MVAAALAPSDANGEALLDPLSAFAASASSTSQPPSRPATSYGREARTSGIEASTGRLYFDLKALHSDLQAAEIASGSGFSRGPPSIRNGNEELPHDDPGEAGRVSVLRRRPSLDNGSNSKNSTPHMDIDEDDDQSGALTPRSSLSAIKGTSPALPPSVAPPRPASRARGQQSSSKSSHLESIRSSRSSSRTGEHPSPGFAPSVEPPEPLDSLFRSNREQFGTHQDEVLYEEAVDEEDVSTSKETQFLSRLYLMSDDDLHHLMGATIRPRSSPRQPSPSFLRPSPLPVQSSAAQHSVSSPLLSGEAIFSPPPQVQEMESVELCRKLSRALAEALAEVETVIQASKEQAERYETQMDTMRRRSQTRQDATLAVCAEHGISAATIDRAVARALADMPQVSINVAEQARAHRSLQSTPNTPALASPRRSSVHSRVMIEGEQDGLSRRAATDVNIEPSLPISLREAMLDAMTGGGNTLSEFSSTVGEEFQHSEDGNLPSPSRSSTKGAHAQSKTGDKKSLAASTLNSRRSDSRSSIVSSRSSLAGGMSDQLRRSNSRTVEGLLPWSQVKSDRKASATTQSTNASAVEADGYTSDSMQTKYTNSKVSIPKSSPVTSPTTPNLRSSSSSPGFFSSFGWRRGRKEVPPVPALPNDLKAQQPSTADLTPRRKATPSPIRSLGVAGSTSLPSDSAKDCDRIIDTSVHTQLDRTSSGRDVISALHDAIGSAPVSPSEQPAHHIDLKGLPKPPSVKAIFLATRILGNDASSLLQNRGRKVSNEVAQKAVEVVKHAIEDGLQIDEAPSRIQSQQTTPRRPSRSPLQLRRDGRQLSPAANQSRGNNNAQKQRPQSMAVQAAAAIVEAASSAATVSRASGRQKRSQAVPHSQPRVEPNLTRLPQYLGYGGGRLPEHATHGQSRTVSDGAERPAMETALPVELEAIVPFDGKPPTLALFSHAAHRPVRTPFNGKSDDESSGDEFEVYGGKGNIIVPEPVRSSTVGFDDRAVDVFGFVYDATPADIRLLRQARKASTPAPACLTGIRVGVAARGGGSDRQSESEREEPDTDVESVTTQEEDLSGEIAKGETNVELTSPPRSIDGSSPSQETSPVRLLGITRSRPSTETSQLSASSFQTGKESGPTSPSQEQKFKASGESSSSAEVAEPGEASTVPSSARKRRPTSRTVCHLLDQLKVMHSKHQAIQKAKWDDFIKHRRTVMARSSDGLTNGAEVDKASKATARGLLAENRGSKAEDQYHHGLIGIRLLGQDKSSKEDYNQFLRLCQEGIPLAHRPKIWAECSGANEVAEPGLYQDLLNEHDGESNPCLVQIDLDVHRTMPTNIYFGGDGPGVPKLRRVLAAYSWYNPTTGYCQGMNNLAATLLLTHATEEEAFWVLVCIVDKILPADYYTSHLLVSQADQRVLMDLVREILPKLAEHLDELGVDLPAVTFAWFLSLYTDCLPVETLFRVWDLLFVEGMIILFRVAVAILMMNEKELIATTSPAAFYGHVHSMTSRLFSVDRLLQLACQDLRSVVLEEKIQKLRAAHIVDIKEELGL